jgi:hypothetical protein
MAGLVGRKDVHLKHAIRAVRKHFHHQFKTHSAGMTRKRYINWRPREILERVKNLLQNILKISDYDEDLSFYLMGILNVRPITYLVWKKEIKNEVAEFLIWVKAFSKLRFLQIFKSDCLKKLCRHYIQTSEDSKTNEILLNLV